MLDWTPVERAAALAVERWPDLDAESAWKLRLAQAIASRHHANRGGAPLPEEAWLHRLPMPIRVTVLAHLVQSCADCGTPAPEAVLGLSAQALPSCLREAANEHLRLHGAQARLFAVLGQPERALEIQKALAAQLIDRFRFEDVTLQVSEWFRLAAALGDHREFVTADAWLERHVDWRQLGRMGRMFVDLARARGLIALGIDERAARDVLWGVLRDPAQPLDARCSAGRWLLRCARSSEEDRSATVREFLAEALRDPERRDVALPFQALSDLDAAIAVGDPAQANRALEVLAAAARGVVGHLRTAAARLGKNAAEYVARFYPY